MRAVLIILITVKHKACMSAVLKMGPAKRMYSQSWFVKQKSFCYRSMVQLYIHWHHSSQQWTMAISVLTV